MGIYDREYYRDDAPTDLRLPGGWTVTTWLVIVNAAMFLLNFVADDWIVRYFAATPQSLTRPYLWWQLLTYGFTHDPDTIDHLFWNMFGLWLFGRSVEAIYGPREFLRFYLCGIVLGGIVWTARILIATGGAGNGNFLLGASGAVTAVTLLFCIHFPKQTILLMMVLPVPAWLLGALIIVWNVFGALSGAGGTAFDVHLVGVVLAIVYHRLGWNFGRWTSRWTGSLPRGLFSRRPRLKVHRPSDAEHDFDDRLAEQADQLLEKINRLGIDSLTASERATLERHSRRMRDRHR